MLKRAHTKRRTTTRTKIDNSEIHRWINWVKKSIASFCSQDQGSKPRSGSIDNATRKSFPFLFSTCFFFGPILFDGCGRFFFLRALWILESTFLFPALLSQTLTFSNLHKTKQSLYFTFFPSLIY